MRSIHRVTCLLLLLLLFYTIVLIIQMKLSDTEMDKERGQTVPRTVTNHSFQTDAVGTLVISCSRVSVSNVIRQLIDTRPSQSEMFPIVVSQGCADDTTTQEILSFGDVITYVTAPPVHVKLPRSKRHLEGYYRIASHYRHALNLVFYKFGFKAVVVVEDDLQISPDFFDYFKGTLWLLQSDPTLLCVSAWNDNGTGQLINNDTQLLHRTDFFPGLGWMLTRDLWEELSPNWPAAYWDDWLRDPAIRKGRSCIRPEISRTKTNNKNGVSKGLYVDKYVQNVKLNEIFVNFTQLDLTYLLKDNYDSNLREMLGKSEFVDGFEVLTNNNRETANNSVKIKYKNVKEFQVLAKHFGLMGDIRGGIPRTSYDGVVTFYNMGRRVYLVLDEN